MPLHFQYHPYRAPFRQPVRTAHGDWPVREGVIVRLADDNGRAALGEIAPLADWGTETLADAIDLCRRLPSTVDEAELRHLPDTLPCCQFAFETALDGLRWPAPPAPVRTFPLTALLPAGPTALARLEEAAARGHRSFKWKVGVHATVEELSLLPHLFDRLPAGGTLRLDANGAWDLRTAEAWLQACEGKPIEFIEQPFAVGAEEPLFKLARRFSTRLALDESVAKPADLVRWLEFGWPGIYVIKPTVAGSPAKLLRRLEAYEAEAVFSSAFETAVGARAALLLAARASHDHRPLGFGTIGAFADPALNLPDPGPTLSTKWLNRLEPSPVWDHLSNLPHAA